MQKAPTTRVGEVVGVIVVIAIGVLAVAGIIKLITLMFS